MDSSLWSMLGTIGELLFNASVKAAKRFGLKLSCLIHRFFFNIHPWESTHLSNNIHVRAVMLMCLHGVTFPLKAKKKRILWVLSQVDSRSVLISKLGKASPNKQTEYNGRSGQNNEAIMFFTLHRMYLPWLRPALCSHCHCKAGPGSLSKASTSLFLPSGTCRDKWNYLDLLQCLGFIILTSFPTAIVVVWVMSRSLWAALCFTPGFWWARFRELWNDNALIR